MLEDGYETQAGNSAIAFNQILTQIQRCGSMKALSAKRVDPREEEPSLTHEEFLEAKETRLEALALREEERRARLGKEAIK